MKKKVKVYQSELGYSVPLEYMGTVKYIGETFGVDGLTDGEKYIIVKDQYNCPKVVDDSGEDYVYDLNNPKPLNGLSKGGKFKVVEDYSGELKKIIINLSTG